MAVIDPTTNIGKLRLRCGDYSDFPIFPDEVYQSVLDETGNNLTRSATIMCTYILAALSQSTHQRLAVLEVYGNQFFDQYLQYVKAVILNPNLMTFTPLPYTPLTYDEFGNQIEVPLVQFQKDWNGAYIQGTSSQELHILANAPWTGSWQ